MPASTPTRLSRPNAATGPTAIIAIFVVVGIVGIAGSLAVLNMMPERGLGVIFGALIIVPSVIGMMVAAFPQARSAWRNFWARSEWWFWLPFLLFVGSSVWRVRSASEVNANGLDAFAFLTRVAPQFIVIAILLYCQLRARPRWLGQMYRGAMLPMGLYCAACLLSVLWSIKILWTGYKAAEIASDYAVMALILSCLAEAGEFEKVWNWVWLIFGLEAAWTWISIPIWPEDTLGDGFRLAGAFPNVSSNGLGAAGAILCVITLCRLLPLNGHPRNRTLNWFIFLFGMATMLMAQTRNAIAGFLIAAVMVCWYTKRLKWVFVGSIAGAGLLFLTGLVEGLASGRDLSSLFVRISDTIQSYLLRGQSTAELESASSRTIWWSFGWDQFLKRPFTGYGAYTGGKFVVLDKLGVDVPHLHSDYVETLVGLSIWGLIPLILAVLVTWYFLARGVRNPLLTPDERQLAMEATCIMMITTIRSIFDIEIVWHAPLLFMLLIGYAEMIRRTLKIRREAKESERGINRLQESW